MARVVVNGPYNNVCQHEVTISSSTLEQIQKILRSKAGFLQCIQPKSNFMQNKALFQTLLLDYTLVSLVSKRINSL